MVEEEKELIGESATLESPHSVKFSVNAKGMFSGECKVYAETPIVALEVAKKIAVKIEAFIKEKNGG